MEDTFNGLGELEDAPYRSPMDDLRLQGLRRNAENPHCKFSENDLNNMRLKYAYERGLSPVETTWKQIIDFDKVHIPVVIKLRCGNEEVPYRTYAGPDTTSFFLGRRRIPLEDLSRSAVRAVNAQLEKAGLDPLPAASD